MKNNAKIVSNIIIIYSCAQSRFIGKYTCILALIQYIKVAFCNSGLKLAGSHWYEWGLSLTIKKGPEDFLWHSSKVDMWRWNMCVFLAWSIWFAWWTSTQCRSMPYFRQWCWRVGNVSFRSAALSTSNSALTKFGISILVIWLNN